MTNDRKNFSSLKDTPATRKRRLQERLQELSVKGEEEMAMLSQSLEKIKNSFKPHGGAIMANETGGSKNQKTRSSK